MNRRSLPTCVLLLTAILAAAGAMPCAGAEAVAAIRRSDVVFMYDNPAMYEPYGCTVVGWAGAASRERIDRAHAAGVRLFTVSVGFLTEFSRVIDFSDDFLAAAARNFAGETFVVPWLWDHKHKGQPAWWWCTNSPLYRSYLEEQLADRMSLGPDGLHIDDYRGSSGAVTWLEACFCRHCMAAFRNYLGKHVARAKLDAFGIKDLDRFDYRQFLVERGVTPEEYKRKRPSLPLAGEFYDFHVQANTRYVAEYRRRAEEIRGAPLTLCVNSGVDGPQALAIAPHLSYFCCEVDHAAESLKPARHPIFIYKLADGLRRPVASTTSGQDWAFINEAHKECLVRSWVALSYAMGHNFMAPHRQWCYTEEKGTHWYEGPTEAYAPIYRFARAEAALLDGYEAVAPVAVLYDNAAARQGRGRIEEICVALAERNVPFTVLVAGDDWLDYRLDAESLGRFQAMIVTADNGDLAAMDAGQRQLVEALKTQGKLIVWRDDASLERLVPRPVSVDGSEGVMIVPRRKPTEPGTPVVVHLLNRRYEGASDAMIPQENFTVRLRRDLLSGVQPAEATLHAPGAEPLRLEILADENSVSFRVPKLELWGIVELK